MLKKKRRGGGDWLYHIIGPESYLGFIYIALKKEYEQENRGKKKKDRKKEDEKRSQNKNDDREKF